MKLLTILGALGAFTLAVATLPATSAYAAQEDCAEGETWNEATAKCEKPE